MENKFYHGVELFTDSELRELEREIKSETPIDIFREYNFEYPWQPILIGPIILWVLLRFFSSSFSLIEALSISFSVLFVNFLGFLHRIATTKKYNKKIKLLIGKGQVFSIRGEIIKKAYTNDRLCILFEDNTTIPVFPIAFHAVEEGDFVEMRYIKDEISYGDNQAELVYYSYRIFNITLHNEGLTGSMDLDHSFAGSIIDQYRGYSRRKKWERSFTNPNLL